MIPGTLIFSHKPHSTLLSYENKYFSFMRKKIECLIKVIPLIATCFHVQRLIDIKNISFTHANKNKYKFNSGDGRGCVRKVVCLGSLK
jgi:hypothetical protein